MWALLTVVGLNKWLVKLDENFALNVEFNGEGQVQSLGFFLDVKANYVSIHFICTWKL